ncbi:MAG: FAD-dependent oxidoreductase [Candidatus Aminicenantes bacterium]|nr:FAD-dependent oxidoreductase [Candidatus Aminicenantes bacterium]
MTHHIWDRRDFLKTVLAGIPLAAWDWSAFPRGDVRGQARAGTYDAVVIGSGLGGLSAAAAFARHGFKVVVLEQHSVPGGYASAFTRPGGFTFDVSLHSMTVGLRDGVPDLIFGFPEIRDIAFSPHRPLYRAIYPDYDIRVPDRDVSAYVALLTKNFPGDGAAIEAIFADMKGLSDDVGRLSGAAGDIDMSKFPAEFPYLFKNFNRTWGAMLDERVKNPKLKAVISGLWGYFGLPPAKLSPFYYAMPLIGYLEGGGFYPAGTSQKISDAFAGIVKANGGEVRLNTRVERILTRDHAAYGVRTSDGAEIQGRAVVSNANAVDTLTRMMPDEKGFLASTLARMDRLSISYSSFLVWLGLKTDLAGKAGLEESEIFYYPGYDIEAEYEAALAGGLPAEPGFGLTVYDNVCPGCSPKGKNTLNIIVSQGFDYWKKYETDYFYGNKDAYTKEKLRLADILIDRVEKTLLPGLRKAIEVQEVATPLTNLRFTSNPRGAIYGWNQTVDNSGQSRFPQRTPVKNLYLSGAWTFPGHGYTACIPSGLACFAEVVKDWEA